MIYKMINENIIIINMVIYNDLFWTNYIFNNSIVLVLKQSITNCTGSDILNFYKL